MAGAERLELADNRLLTACLRLEWRGPPDRLGTPLDMGAAVLFLCSPATSWISGETLRVNGGAHHGQRRTSGRPLLDNHYWTTTTRRPLLEDHYWTNGASRVISRPCTGQSARNAL